MQRFISFECDIHDIANKLNEVVENNKDLFIVDYKTLESAYGVIVIVEVGL